MRYTTGFKKNIVRRLLIPDSLGVHEISEETGVAIPTLYNWLKKYREQIELANYQKTPEEWALPEKSNALLEVAALSPEEQGEWLRRNGLQSIHLTLWKKELSKALAEIGKPVNKTNAKEARKKIRELEKEIRRKDKALAEMTALVVLKKKLETFLEERDQ